VRSIAENNPVPEAVPPEPRSGPRPKVLVVDDDPINRTTLEELLSESGYASDGVEDGAAALVACASERYDVVFMDSRMPGLDGNACVRVLRQSTLCRQPVIIGVTADVSDHAREQGLEAGMNQVLFKPVRAVDIVAVLDRWSSTMTSRQAQSLPAPSQTRPISLRWLDQATMASMDAQTRRRGSGLWDRTLTSFEESSAARLQEIETARQACDVYSAGESAQLLKHNCLMLGFVRAAALCRPLELLHRETPDSEWGEMLATLRHGIAESVAELRRYIASSLATLR
jgi:CheY-like chemotaxis protein/HPt (histidine-containing phosphotransfer) domain-containing protein